MKHHIYPARPHGLSQLENLCTQLGDILGHRLELGRLVLIIAVPVCPLVAIVAVNFRVDARFRSETEVLQQFQMLRNTNNYNSRSSRRERKEENNNRIIIRLQR